MKKKLLLLFTSIYSLALTGILIFYAMEEVSSLIFVVLLLPIFFYFLLRIAQSIPFLKTGFRVLKHSLVINIFSTYTLFFILATLIANSIHIRQPIHLLFVVVLLPTLVHFYLIFSRFFLNLKHRRKLSKEKVTEVTYIKDTETTSKKTEQVEKERRAFFKMIAGAGAGVVVASLLNPKRASAAFFGSVPGPGIIAVKDSLGTKIDPSIKSPTDGYGVSNLDTTSYPAFYGFVNKDGAWYIMQENPQNTFTYSTGASAYSTGWTGRAALTYTTYDTTF